MRRQRALGVVVVIVGSAALYGLLRVGGYYAGAARWRHTARPAGGLTVPETRSIVWRETSPLTEALVADWASQPLPDWQEEGKVTAPRVLMAKLALVQDLDEVNAYLLAQVPWGRSGSTWELHPEGDYDFTLAALTAILYLYGDDPARLYPETRTHLLDVLLVEEGHNPRVAVPRTLGLIRDTENHLLMTEGSRYLKNRWLALHGNTEPRFDNTDNGMEHWILAHLRELQTAGLYEFNSIPYMGYTLTALMNLEAFGSEAVSAAAREILDRETWAYALGSLGFRRYAPFRRQIAKAGITSLGADYQTALVRTWMSLYPGDVDVPALTEGLHHALWGALLPYRPPDEAARWILEKPETYFVRVGHGPGASPEIYSGGPGYLLSAGGVHRGARSMIVARPITLMLDVEGTGDRASSEASDLDDVIHMAGPGADFRKWNNTGVYRDFAVASSPVHVPEGWYPNAADATWRVYVLSGDLSVAVHSGAAVGLVAIFHESNANTVLTKLLEANDDAKLLERTFRWPDGPVLTYNVHAPKNRWVLVCVDGEPLDRAFDTWPRMDGVVGH
ncbi:MAG: hypothetical protein MUF84_14695 [Anaerolineae bacterium]|nr:hypothetical protein [Anaerolineae bacterium]